MPARKYAQKKRRVVRKRTTRRKTMYPRKRYPRNRVVIGRNPSTSPMQDRLFTKLKFIYSWSQTVNAAAVVTGLTVPTPIIRTNMYDPTGGGNGQPFGYDQYNVFYKKYRVYGIAYKFQVLNLDGTKPFCVVVRPQWNTTADTDFDLLAERPMSRKAWGMGVNNNKIVTVSGYASVAKVYGVRPENIRDDAYYESDIDAVGGPVRQIYLMTYLHNTDLLNSFLTRCRMEVIYYVEYCSKQQQLAKS